MSDLKQALIDVEDSILVIVDIQDHFLKKIHPERAELLLSRVDWLMKIAKILKVPMIVTVEESHRLGGFSRFLAENLPPETQEFNKMVFGLAGQADILQAVQETGRTTAVLVGLETDVCISQSAIGLLHTGFRVVAISDATDSPGAAHEVGLERMRGAGVLVTSLKVVFYEWLRTVEMSNTIGQEYLNQIGTPKGITL